MFVVDFTLVGKLGSGSEFLLLVTIIIIITSTSDLQPSTPIVNQLPGQLVYTEIRTIHKKKFLNFHIALNDSDCLRHMACIAVVEPIIRFH